MENAIYLLLLSVIFQAIPPAGPKTQTNSASQDRPIRLKTDLIELRAVVTDRQGKLVGDLKKEDFDVLENGHPQQLSFFSLERLPTTAATPAIQSTPTKTETNLNRPVPFSQPRRTIVLFVDTLHLSDENYLRSRQMLRKFIEEQIRDDDLVAVISSGGPMGLFNQFTTNRRVLLKAIEMLRPWGNRQSKFTPYIAYMVTVGDSGAISAAISIVSAEEGFPATRQYVESLARGVLSEAAAWRGSSLRTLEAAMDQMARTPGQRIIFYISEGFSLQGNAGNANSEVNNVTSRAVRSGILVYSLDAKGLETYAAFSDASTKVVMSPNVERYISDSNKEQRDGINALAKDTGGDAFFNNNHMGGSMTRALDSNSVYYSLGYYPSSEKNETTYRRLTVRVKNHPEYVVRAQKGYQPLAVKSEKEIAKQTPQKKVLDAIAAPLPQTTIGVTAAAYYLERDMDEAQVSVEVFIDGTTLEYGKQESHQAIDCEVTTVIFDKSGKSINVTTDKVQGSLTGEQIEEGRKHGYRYLKRVDLKPGIYQARIGVRENGSERVGTASAWVEVPDLNRAKLALSSIVLSRLGNADSEKQAGRNDGPSLLSPDLRQGIAYFKQGSSLVYELTLYESSARNPNSSELLLQSEVTSDGQSIYRSNWQPVTERLIRVGKKGRDVGGRLNLDMKPGIYELRITVKDSKSNRSAQQSVVFEVEN